MSQPFVVTVASRHNAVITVVAHDAAAAQRRVRRLLEFANTHADSYVRLSASRLPGLRLVPEAAEGQRTRIPKRVAPEPMPPGRIVTHAELLSAARGGRGV
jgi:hypothetical protein